MPTNLDGLHVPVTDWIEILDTNKNAALQNKGSHQISLIVARNKPAGYPAGAHILDPDRNLMQVGTPATEKLWGRAHNADTLVAITVTG